MSTACDHHAGLGCVPRSRDAPAANLEGSQMIPNIPPFTANAADPAPEFPWPPGKRCAVFPAFDVDAETAWLQHDFKNVDRLVTLSFGGYEERVGVPKILDYLRAVEIKATFFIPGWWSRRIRRCAKTSSG